MDFALSENQEELRGLAARILEDRSGLQHLKERDRSDDWYDLPTWQEFAKTNLLGIALPESAGGLGFGLLDLCMVLREVGSHVAPLPATPTRAPGVTTTRQQAINHEPLYELQLEGVQVGADAVLGSIEQGSEILAFTLNRTTVAMCAVVSGLAERALRMTAQYTCDRKQFDRAIGTFQAVGQRMADCFIDASAIELTMLQAATHLDEGRDDPLEIATAKF